MSALPDPVIDWRRVAATQGGVISRSQLIGTGLLAHDVKRLVRRRDLTAVHRGVFLTHTGRPTWEERAWAAVLSCWPAALGGRSALPHPPPNAPVSVIIPTTRTVVAPPGVRVMRRKDFNEELALQTYPPRQKPAFAAIDAVAGMHPADAYALLASVVQRRLATAGELQKALLSRRRVPERPLLAALVADLEVGACSVLERAYLNSVERAHDLPRAGRQSPDDAGGVRSQRDVLYRQYGLVVELDGRAFHDNAPARDRDAARDLAAAAERDYRTVRLTTGLVLRSPCAIARSVEKLLQRGGWRGSITACPACPTPKISAT